MKLLEKFTGIYGHLRFRCNCEKTFTAIYGIFRWKSFPMEHFPMQLGGPERLARLNRIVSDQFINIIYNELKETFG